MIEQLYGNAAPVHEPGPGPVLILGVWGENFVQGAVIYFNGVALETFFQEQYPGSLSGQIPPALLTVVGVYDVWVENPAPSAAPSNRLPFRVYGPPTITSVSRTTVNRGDSTAIIQVTVAEGDYLDSFSDIMIDGVRLETTFEGNTLTATLTSEFTANAGDYLVTVTNGLESTNSQPLSVVNLSPILLVIVPEDAPVGTGDLPVTIQGADIAPGAVVWFGGVAMETTVIDQYTATIVVPAATFEEPGNLPVWIENPHADETSDIGSFIIYGPVTLGGVSQASIPRNSGPTEVTINVSGTYTRYGQVLVDGDSVPTVHESAGVVRVTLSAEQLSTAGTLALTFIDNGVTSTNAVQVIVSNPAPTISSTSHTGALLGATGEVTVTGTGFVPESQVRLDGLDLTTYYASSTELSFELNLTVGELNLVTLLEIANGEPGGGTATTPFEIVDPEPGLDSIRPVSANVNHTGPLTVHGSNFRPGAQLWAGRGSDPFTQIAGILTGDSVITAQIDSAMSADSGTVRLQVRNVDSAFPSGYLRGPDVTYESGEFEWHVTSGVDPCQALALMYPGSVSGTLMQGDCAVPIAIYTEYQDRYDFTPTQTVSALSFTASAGAFVQIFDGTVKSDLIFSFGSATSRKLYLPVGPSYRALIANNTGGPDSLSYSFDVNTATNDFGPCVGGRDPIVRPGVVLNGQSLATTDCFGFDRFDPDAGVSRFDRIALMVAGGERIVVHQRATEFVPVSRLVCAGPSCPAQTIPGVAGDGVSTIDYTFPMVPSGTANWSLELSSAGEDRGAYLGTYDVEILDDPDFAIDLCSLESPYLPRIEYGTQIEFAIDETDCVRGSGALSEWYQLYTIDPTELATMLVLLADPGAQFRLLAEGNVVGSLLVAGLVNALLPLQRYVLEVGTGTTFDPSITGTVDAGPNASEDVQFCPPNVWLWPGIVTTQVLASGGCSQSDGEGNDRILDRFDLRVPAGNTVRITMRSSTMDAELWLQTVPTTGLITDDNSGGGTDAQLTYTNPGPEEVVLEVIPTTTGSDFGEIEGTYTLQVELVE